MRPGPVELSNRQAPAVFGKNRSEGLKRVENTLGSEPTSGRHPQAGLRREALPMQQVDRATGSLVRSHFARAVGDVITSAGLARWTQHGDVVAVAAPDREPYRVDVPAGSRPGTGWKEEDGGRPARGRRGSVLGRDRGNRCNSARASTQSAARCNNQGVWGR
jgi:hypothetical protein